MLIFRDMTNDPSLEYNDFNGALFTLRGRSLNSTLYQSSEIFGAIGMSFILDSNLRRRTRAFGSIAALLSMVFITCIWAYFYQMYVAII